MQEQNEIMPTVEDTVRPENPGVPLVEKLFAELYYRLRIVTRSKAEPSGAVTSLPTRVDRANLYKEVVRMRKSDRQGGVYRGWRKEYRTRSDRFRTIEREFHDQQALRIAHPTYGDLTACYTVLNRESVGQEPPIVVVSGASNGVESMDALVRELAEQQPARRVYVLGYPEAPSGVVSEEFAKAVETAQGFGPHTEVFRAMIEHLMPEGEMELWGFSAGGAIASTLLTDEAFGLRVAKAVLLCPWGSVDQSPKEFAKGTTHDAVGLVKWLKRTANYVFITDPTKEEQKRWKMRTLMGLMHHGYRAVVGENLQRVKLRAGTAMTIVSGGDDLMTRSAQVFNPETEERWRRVVPTLTLRTAVVPDALHQGPFLQPEEFVRAGLGLRGSGRV